MKRFTILAVLLLLVGVSTGFAIELKPSVSLSGNETLTLGMDLNTGAIGFNNETDATLQVNLVSDDSQDTHKGEGAIYGSITISNFDLYWVDGNENYNGDKNVRDNGSAEVNPDVSATLYIPPFSIGLDAPGMSADVVAEIEANNGYDDFSNIVMDAVVDYEDTVDWAPAYGGHGMSLRYTDPGNVFWVQADVKTGQDAGYVGVDPLFQALALGLEGSVTVAPLTFGAGAFYGFGYANNIFDVGAYVDNPIVAYLSSTLTLEGIGTASVGVDVAYDPGAVAPDNFRGQFFASAQMNFNKEATSFLLLKALFDTNYVIEDTQEIGDPAVPAVPTNARNHFDGYVDFEIPAGTLAGDLKVSVIGYFLEVLSPDIEYAAKAVVGYKVWSQGDMYILPQLTAAYGKPNALRNVAVVDNPGDSILALNPAVEIGLTANPVSTLTIGWTSGNLLLADNGLGSISMALKITY